MTPADHRRLADALLPAVLGAGALQVRYAASDIAVLAKADRSPVTAADHESELLLIAALQAAAPGVPILAEEQAAAGMTPVTGRRFFAVDPLDGTKEFVAGRSEYTINIGLIEDGQTRFGLVYAPALSALYVTDGDDRATFSPVAPDAVVHSLADCPRTPLQTRRPPDSGLHALTSRSTRDATSTALFAAHGVTCKRPMGSSLKFCVIAAGEADLYARFGPTNEWDTAAGQAILTAAGGTVITGDGMTLTYGKAGLRYLNPDFIAWGRAPKTPEGP